MFWTPNKFRCWRKIPNQHSDLGPLLFKAPYFSSTPQQSHQKMNLYLFFVTLTGKCKKFPLQNIIVIGAFVIQLGHIKMHVIFKGLLQFLTIKHSIVFTNDCVEKKFFSVSMIDYQMVVLLKLSPQLWHSPRRPLDILFAQHKRKTMFVFKRILWTRNKKSSKWSPSQHLFSIISLFFHVLPAGKGLRRPDRDNLHAPFWNFSLALEFFITSCNVKDP